MTETERVIGFEVSWTKEKDPEAMPTPKVIPEEVLAHMTRRFLRPIVDGREMERIGKGYIIIDGFAAISDEV